ncbi:MAG: hypothetical protein Q9163_004758 [Psora crenata]
MDSPNPRTSFASEQVLRDLVTISEDDPLPLQPASPAPDAGHSERLDFCPGQTTPTRSATDPAVSHGSIGQLGDSTIVRANTTGTTHGTLPADSGSSKTKANPPRAFSHSNQKRSPVDASQPGHSIRRHSTIDTNWSESFEDTAVWDRKAILSLDGGGIRGYSELLILQELMRVIGKLEKTRPPGPTKCDGPAESSFHPLHPTPSMATDTASCHSAEKIQTQATDSSAWLPCHYFDYMAGTSTGGLVGILLGRLRMNVDDCIAEYEKLGKKVFAHSRWFHLRSPLWWPREKYSHKVLEEVVQGVVNDRVPKVGTFPGGKTFAFDENRCRVVVIAFQEQIDGLTERPYLFRTYKNLRKGATKEEKKIDRNPGPAHDIPIWQVARATSAAPTYFKEAKIEGRKYLDGGFGANNPCREIYNEVRKMNNYNENCASTIISIGTGKNKKKRMASAKGIKEVFRAGLGKFIDYENFARRWAADSETVHEDMISRGAAPNSTFKYFRFNVEHGLDSMKLDDWRTRGRLRVGLGRCIGKTRSGWPRSKENDVPLDDLSGKRAVNGYASHHNNQKPGSSETHQDPPILVDAEASMPSNKIPRWFQPRNNTLESIRSCTQAYLDEEDTKNGIAECARILVDGRRGRALADPHRWERACFGAWYQCSISGCQRGEKEYRERHNLERHMLDKHRDIHGKHDEEARKRLEKALDLCKVVVH